MNKIIKSLFAVLAFSLFFASAINAQAPQTTPTGLPLIKSVTPSDEQIMYGDKIPVLITVENFQLTNYQQNITAVQGQGHVHLWLDDANPTPESAQKSINGESIYSDVAYGDHTLIAELVNNDHTSLNPQVKTTVKFKNSPLGSPSPVQPSGFDKKTAFVILVIVALVIIAAWWYTKEEDDEETEKVSRVSKGTSRSKRTKAKKTTKKASKKRK